MTDRPEQTPPETGDAELIEARTEVPTWDTPRGGVGLRGLIETWGQVALQPRATFGAMSKSGRLSRPMGYVLVLALPAVLIDLLTCYYLGVYPLDNYIVAFRASPASALEAPRSPTRLAVGDPSMDYLPANFIIKLLIALALPVLAAVVVRAVLAAIDGIEREREGFIRLSAYAFGTALVVATVARIPLLVPGLAATPLVWLLPLFGDLGQMLLFVWVMTIGLSRLFEIPARRAFAALVAPGVLVLLVALGGVLFFQWA